MKLNPSIAPRQWQSNALEEWRGGRRGVVQVVTGGGKTVFAYLCIASFLDDAPDGRVVIVVPTLALLDQWFVDICAATDLLESQISTYSGEGHSEAPSKINILVLDTARAIAADLLDYGPRMLVVDECHRAGSPENARALLGEYDATLGLSATPEREGDEGFDELISPALGSIIFRYGYPEARADGVIVDFDLVNINISSPADSVIIRAKAAQEKHLKSAPKRGESGQALEERAQRLARTALRTPWAVKLVLLHRQERVIVFHERVESLSKIVALLEKHGQNSVPYHSHLSKAHRRDNLKLFRQGIVNVLVTCRALDEGANVPEASVAVVARSTSSTRQRIQRLGRVLRHASGKHSALIYTLYAGEEEGLALKSEELGLEGVASVEWKTGVSH